MIGTSTYEYIFIQACIFGLHHVAPLSISYCLIQTLCYVLRSAFPYRLPLILEICAAGETVFYIVVHLWYRQRLQAQARHPPALSREGRRELFALCNANIPDAESYFRKWFLGAPVETIKKDNVKEFFLWAFFNRDGLPGRDDEELEEYIVTAERVLGRKIDEGRGSAACLRLTLDPVNMLHRSILWYLCVSFVDFLTFCRFQYYGFHFHRTALSRFFTLFPLRPVALLGRKQSPVKYITYWHRPHKSRTKLPIVFIHGIGIGLYPYVDFLRELNSASGVEGSGVDEQVGIIAVEIMPVSFRITHPALGIEEVCDEIQTIIEHHGFKKYVLVAHSYGTAVASYMLKSPQLTDRIGPAVLIDPITVMLHLPDVAFNFTRRQPRRANEHQLYYFAGMDMGVSHTLARQFFWSDVILWKKDICGRRITFSLAERDLIVNTVAVGRYLGSSGCDFTEHVSTNVTCNCYARSTSNANGCGEGDDKGYHSINGRPRHSPLANRNGFSATHSHIDNVHATSPHSDAKINVHDTELMSGDWKSRPWRGRGLEVLWQRGIDHAQAFDSAKRRERLVSVIRAYSAQPAD